MLYQQLSEHPNWWFDSTETNKQIPSCLMPWLQEQGSLTEALIALSENNFKVVVQSEEIISAHNHEQQKLKFDSDQTSLIREVELHIHNQAVVFARSVIPLGLIQQKEGGLDNLGSQPLGQILFKEGRPRSSKREFTNVKVNREIIHARRTPYEYKNHQVLVSEFFLPSFLSYLDKD